MKFHEELEELGACGDDVVWVRENNYGLHEAWEECLSPGWMVWLLAKKAGERGWPSKPDVVRLICQLVRRSLRHVPVYEVRPLQAVEAAEAWAENPTKANRQRAADAANVAARCIDFLPYAARAAAAAARVAADDALTAADANNAVVLAAGAFSDRTKEIQIQADIIRTEVNLEGIS